MAAGAILDDVPNSTSGQPGIADDAPTSKKISACFSHQPKTEQFLSQQQHQCEQQSADKNVKRVKKAKKLGNLNDFFESRNSIIQQQVVKIKIDK